MNVLQIVHSANPAGGGPIEGIKQLARALERAGHRNHVLCLDPPTAILRS
jgi:hypothetical protein